ncbi:agmatinase [Pseudemcibacter aquimaris]|uniref:agmatinase n=1 Tax=Pseudemcibacter aquimaris TaxID=2857064 RepID=UPI0020121E46|nr:agmatinase [Pseudemcibacter aquimaris]MCC3861402.1 agmatinase [Pseudemcibacter aquimaris]WDU58172.1 agmatinase [Pseudemcibacter aquimaris]
MGPNKELLEDWWDDACSGQISFMRFPHSKDVKNADIAILGVPYDLGTTNRPGARFGPRAMREQSTLTGEFEFGLWPWEYHIAEHHTVIDYGDICDFAGYPERMVAQLEKATDEIITNDAACFAMGGDHFISLPLLRSHVKKHGPLALIHFDAHTDTWVDENYHHGTMFYHAIKEGLIDTEHSIQIGIRTPNSETHGIEIIFATELDEMRPAEVAEQIRKRVGDNKAYLTFDIDFLDPAYAPGTGTPVSGGPTVMAGRKILKGLRGMNIVGADLVEIAPAYDPIGNITAVAGATLGGDILYLLSEALRR